MKLNPAKYNSMVSNASTKVKVSSTIFKEFIADVKSVIEGNDDLRIALLASLNTHEGDYIKHPGYGVTGGTSTAYTLTLNPAVANLVDGVGVAIKAHVASGANPTLDVNSKGAKPIKRPNGSAAVLVKDAIYTLRYDGVNFILQGEGAGGNAVAADLLSGKTATSDAGDIVGTMNNLTSVSYEIPSGSRFAEVSTKSVVMAPNFGYHDQATTRMRIVDPNFTAENIKKDVSLFGITGTLVVGQFQKGTATDSNFTVSGLPFVPAVVVVTEDGSTSTMGFWLYSNGGHVGSKNVGVNISNIREEDKIIIHSGGFTFNTTSGSSGGKHWIAIGN